MNTTTILNNLGIERLNEMQQETILAHNNASNVLLLSPTGSGKTLAYLLSLLNHLQVDTDDGLQAVVIAPTRELALQIESVFRSMKSGVGVLCVYGGHSFAAESRSLQQPPSVLIGTPGRLADHIRRRTVNLSMVEHVVLDEFDKTLEMGFEEEVETIFSALRSLKHRTLLSATAAVDIPTFVGMTTPVVVDFTSVQQQQPAWEVDIIQASNVQRKEVLYDLLSQLEGASSLVFCNFREQAEEVSDYLWSREVSNEFFHGGMQQEDRERALIKLRNGSTRTLVTTDLAARGIDVTALDCIVHYQLPQNPEAYLHRNGRTARMNRGGKVYVLSDPASLLPEFIQSNKAPYKIMPPTGMTPLQPLWQTLYVGKGKKEKISKGDLLGFLVQRGGLQADDIGQIDVRDHCCYVAINTSKIKPLLETIKKEKIKKMQCKFDVAY